VAIRAPICLTQTSEFLSLMNPLLTQMSGESASVEIQASAMTRRQRRLTLIGGALSTVALAVGLVLIALKDSIVFFNSPTDLVEKHVVPGQRMRVGGLVKEGSLWRGDNLAIRFALMDANNEVTVAYRGQLPDLFREGQGVIAEGALDTAGTFQADTILAKHDERYMPKEVADALKKQGHWQREMVKTNTRTPRETVQ
jgi:cytochrome c-type biogenesis protein CcmE